MIKLSKSIRRFLARHGSNIGYYTSRNRLDKRIAELFSYKKNGVFIEAGAADGFIESHTLFLEKNYVARVFSKKNYLQIILIVELENKYKR